jgi:pimeloyl-ACP methyl ester carboxylesterase
MPVTTGIFYFSHETEINSRPPILLIHGAGGIHLSWPPQVRRMNGQRVLAVDLPGHGKSEIPGRRSIFEYADDVLTFLHALKISSVVTVGHSMGGVIALKIAIEHPELISNLVLIASSANLHVSPVLLGFASKDNTFPAAVDLVIENSFGKYADLRVKELTAKRMLEIHPDVLYGDLVACDGFDMLDGLPRIKARTLIMCGDEDKMTPLKHSLRLHEGIDDSQLEVVQGAGHMLMLEQPEIVLSSLEKFLDP